MNKEIGILAALDARRSVRGYLPDAVPRDVVAAVIEAALRAPTAMNTQPWRFTVLSGEPLERVRARNADLLEAGAVPQPDFPVPPYAGEYRERQVEIYRRLLETLGIARGDKAARNDWQRYGYRFFGAPVVILLHFEAALDPIRSHFDLGTVSQSITLAALAQGLGSCLCLLAVGYPDVLREIAGIPKSDKIALGIALGYPDPAHPANRLHSPRLPLARVTRWLGFD
jgi:nitroreductase